MNKKVKIKCTLVLLVLQAFFCTYTFAQSRLQDTLYVESAPFNSTSIVQISYPRFEEDFCNNIKFKIVVNEDTLSNLNLFISKARYKRTNNGIDVRAKFIYIKKDGTKTEICMSKFYIMIDGRLVKGNTRFFNFLKRLTI